MTTILKRDPSTWATWSLNESGHVRVAQPQLAMGRSLHRIQGHRTRLIQTTRTLRRTNTKFLEHRTPLSLLPIASHRTCTRGFAPKPFKQTLWLFTTTSGYLDRRTS